ncbi:MAG: chemotaxis protein CheA [Deltaproteobacteria bacterium]|nr:chemotaxis protein CheA [Deltaproteobacteria bacterium]
MPESSSMIVRPADAELMLEVIPGALERLEDITGGILSLEGRPAALAEKGGIVSSPLQWIAGLAGFLDLGPMEKLTRRLLKLLDQVGAGYRVVNTDDADCLLTAVEELKRRFAQVLSIAGDLAGENNADAQAVTIETDIADLMAWIADKLSEENLLAPDVLAQETPDTAIDSISSDISPVLTPPAQPCLIPGKEEEPKEQMVTITPQMAQDFIGEGQDYLRLVEDALLAIEADSSKRNMVEVMLRGFHSFKGIAGLLLALIRNEQVRQNHILNKMRLLVHTAEHLIQTRRESGVALSRIDTDLLLSVCDHTRRLMDLYYRGDEAGYDVSNFIEKMNKAAGETVSYGLAAAPGPAEQKSFQDAAVIKTLKQVAESLEAGLKQLMEEATRVKAAGKVRIAFQTLKRTFTAAGQPDQAKQADQGLNSLKILIQNWSDETQAGHLPVLQNMLRLIIQMVAEKEELSEPEAGTPDLSEKQEPGGDIPTGQELTGPERSAMIKVPQERLDHLMNLIGELVVGKNSLRHLARSIAVDDDRPDIAAKVKEVSNAISRIGDGLQASIMEVRMTPVSHVFEKFPRLVRDLARRMNKQIVLEMDGAETELDKTIIEAISTPLVHLVRNAADHGIETPEVRRAAGKPVCGVIRLRAHNQGHHAMVEVSDDGRGIDTKKLSLLAIEKRIVDLDTLERMSEEERVNLVFHSGFSSAIEVTDVSGRGVGMDVVRKDIEAIGGTVTLTNRPGFGVTALLRLPLTLAVSRGLKVSVSDEHYYLPLEFVLETIKTAGLSFHSHRGRKMVVIRDQTIPVLNLKEVLGLNSGGCSYSGRNHGRDEMSSLVILNVTGQKTAVEVDLFFKEEEYVIKNIEGPLGTFPEFMGATITSEGKIILVLNPLRL